MDQQDSGYSVLIAGSKHSAERIAEPIAFRNDVGIRRCTVNALSSRQVKNNPPNLLLCECSGFENTYPHVLDFLADQPTVPVFIITAAPNYADAVQYLKMGVSEYIALPPDQSLLVDLLDSSIEEWKSSRLRKSFNDRRKKSFDFGNIIGTSPQMQNVIDRSRKLLSNPNITVLVLGETGTGKELLAKAIHFSSINSSQPFVEIACSSIPESLLESELFGHVKGAFTDAKNDKIGLFELAGKGTIFLDEIGDISPVIQSKLLNALEEKKIRRLGGIDDIPVEARIITATSKDLHGMVKRGEMRKDLYYRLAVFSLEMPPLRDRSGDIPILANHFLQEFARQNEKAINGFTPKALEKLEKEHWEGNVRELKHVIERAVLLSNSKFLDEDDLEMITTAGTDLQQETNLTSESEKMQTDGHVVISVPLVDATLSHIEKSLIKVVLQQVQGNKRKASKILKISRPRLDRIIKNDPHFFQ